MKAVEVPQSVMEALNDSPDNQDESQSNAETKGSNPPQERKYGFVKGKSGNPSGRPKGALGKSTLIKQAIMAEAEGLLLENAPKVISTVIQQAKKGCLQSQRLIWQSIIPAKRAVELSAKEDGPAVIKINIQALESKVTLDEPVEAEFEVIDDGD